MIDGINLATPRNNGIDLIRGLSIIAVILLHVHIRIPFNQGWLGEFFPQKLVNIIFFSGYYGVIVFFVISGFLITTSSIKRWGNLSNIKYGQFFQIRFARIMPCLIGLLILLSVLHIGNIKGFVITNTTLDQALYSALTFQINWLQAKIGYLPGPWDALWSLSVEEVFYIFFPLICLVIRNEFTFKLFLLVFIILGPFARCAFSNNEIWCDHSYLSCMDGIAMGCLAALFANKYKYSRKSLILLLCTGLSLFFFVFIFRTPVSNLGLTKLGLNITILETGISLILIALHHGFIRYEYQKNLFTAPLLWFGKNSYEIYLTHSFIVILMVQLFKKFSTPIIMIVPLYIVILVLSGILGHIVAKCYSVPLNRILRGILFYKPSFHSKNQESLEN